MCYLVISFYVSLVYCPYAQEARMFLVNVANYPKYRVVLKLTG